MSVFIIHYHSKEENSDQVVGGSKNLKNAIHKALIFDRQYYDDTEVWPEPTEEEIQEVIDRGQTWSSSKMNIKGYIAGKYVVYEVPLFD